MISDSARSPRLLAGALVAVMIVAACGNGATAVASPTESPTPAPTVRPFVPATPRPTPTPAPTPTPLPTPASAIASLKIGRPYRLVADPANAALTGSIAFDIMGQHLVETINGREIWDGNKMNGLALMLEFQGVKMSETIFNAGAQGAANNTGGKLTFTTISGTRVGIVTAKAGTFGMYALGDHIVMVIGTKAVDTKPLLTSVIIANKKQTAT
jgi:hypothetical protein